jgi:replication factor C subunit 1
MSVLFKSVDRVLPVSVLIFPLHDREKLKIPANVVDQLIAGAQSDIRQVLNMLSTWKLSSDTMDFDEGKALVKANEKYSLMTPFNVISKMFGPYTFSATSRETLGEKMEYYFHDHQFMGLFVQENYLKAAPARLRNLEGKERALQELKLMDKAASSISDGDLIDTMIHGCVSLRLILSFAHSLSSPEQHWALMPLHAVCAFVRPASFMYGGMQAYGGGNSISFPQYVRFFEK